MNGTTPLDPQPDGSHLAHTLDELTSTAAGYYEALMCEKRCDIKAAEPMLNKLKAQPIAKATAKKIEGKITRDEESVESGVWRVVRLAGPMGSTPNCTVPTKACYLTF